MTSYELFKNMVNAKNNNDQTSFDFYAVHFAGELKNNPYPKESKEAALSSLLYGDYLNFTSHRVGDRAAKQKIIARVDALLLINSNNPFQKETIEEKQPKRKEKRKEQQNVQKEEIKEETKEIKEEELREDVNYLLTCMVNAYKQNLNDSYEMYVIHLMDVVTENPFFAGSQEYELFDEMYSSYNHVPPNKRRAFVVGKELCKLINDIEIYPEKIQPKQTVLGVVPEEKKNWLKFLFPWKKEEDSDDSKGTD